MIIGFLILFLMTPMLSFGAIELQKQHVVVNYTRYQYKSGSQNWMMEQHPNGWFYFANNKGVLEFDGVNWNTYSIHNAKVRAVRAGANGRLYVGGLSQFGYFEPNALGELVYTCLSDTIPKSVVGNVWDIHIIDKNVYYRSDNCFFCLSKNGNLKRIPCGANIMSSAVVDNKLYYATSDGVGYVDKDNCYLLPNTNIATLGNVVGMFDFGGKLLLISNLHGVFLYDGLMTQLKTAADNYIKNTHLFSAAMSDSVIALGSVKNGTAIFSLSDNESLQQISVENGLQNKTVISMAFDYVGNLWLGLDNGIDCIRLHSPVSPLLGRNAAIGSGYAACVYRNKLYLGTNQGLFETNSSQTTFVNGTAGQIRSLSVFDDKLFCCGSTSLNIIGGKNSYPVHGISGVWAVRPINETPDKLLAGTYYGLYMLEKTSGKWSVSCLLKGSENFSSKSLLIEPKTNAVWTANKERGVYRLSLSDDFSSVKKAVCYNSSLLPKGDNVAINVINGDVVLASRQGLFKYNQLTDKLEQFVDLENRLEGHVPYTFICQDEDLNVWYVHNGFLKVLRFTEKDFSYRKIDGEAFLGGYLIEDFESLYFLSKSDLIVGTEEGFSVLHKDMQTTNVLNSSVHIRRVYTTSKRDSLVYGCSFLNNDSLLQLNYRNNSIRIEFSAIYSDMSVPMQYSCRLQGAIGAEWSNWGNASSKEYTDLPEGDYLFSVRAIPSNASEYLATYTQLRFTILPPWYRCWWAYCAYVLAGLLFVYYLYMRFCESQKRLVQQKELDMLRQKLEFEESNAAKDQKIDSLKEANLKAELKYKTEELALTTLNIVRKNEMLQSIRKDAIGISHSIADGNLVNLRRRTQCLISSIDTNIEHDDDFAAFQRSFDAVHQDFFHVLQNRFPKLSAKDKMLCAYISMDLMSKEIAPLLNISIRGVEISRYRLRRKLQLSEKENLQEFLRCLQNVKE